MEQVSSETFLIASVSSSLVLGILLFGIGASIRFNGIGYVNRFGAGLDEDLSGDVCLEPSTGIDFCSHKSDLDHISLGNWLLSLGSIIIITGFFIFLLSILGFVAGFRQIRSLLILMMVVICCCVGMEAYLIDIFTNEESSFHDSAKEELIFLLRERYELANPPDNSFTQAMNVIMLQGECCGIKGREDFGVNITYRRQDGFIYNFQNPPVCCQREVLKEKKFKAFAGWQGCQEEALFLRVADVINTEGCYSTLFTYVSDAYGVWLYGILLYLIISHCVDVVLGVIILMRETPAPSRQTDRRLTSMATHGNVALKRLSRVVSSPGFSLSQLALKPSEKRPNLFMPYAKTSSFAGPEDRMMSTEIW